MSMMAFQITGVSIVCSTVCSGANNRKHQSSALLALVRGIYRWPVNYPHKGPVTRKMFDDVIMSLFKFDEDGIHLQIIYNIFKCISKIPFPTKFARKNKFIISQCCFKYWFGIEYVPIPSFMTSSQQLTQWCTVYSVSAVYAMACCLLVGKPLPKLTLFYYEPKHENAVHWNAYPLIIKSLEHFVWRKA